MTKKGENDVFKDLRRKAERKIQRGEEQLQRVSKEEALKTLHELHVHQIELEMQNERLRETQIELQESNSRYTDLFDFAPIGYFVLDKRGVISQVNMTGCSLLGIERNILVEKPFAQFISNEDKDKYHLTHQEVVSDGTGRRCDLKMLRKDSGELSAELFIEPVKDAKDRVTGCCIAVVDITHRKEAELKLIENEDRLKLVIESCNAGTWNWDIQTKRTWWNDRLYEIMGLSPDIENVNSETFFHHIHPQDLPRVQKNLSHVLKSGTDFADTFRIIRADGDVRWLAILGRMFRDDNQNPLEMMCVVYDITERKDAEEAVRKSEAKFHGLFNTMSEAFILFELIRDDSGKVIDCRVLDANPAVEEMTGIHPADAIGHTMTEIFPDTDEFWFDAYDKVETTGEPIHLERRFDPLDRSYQTNIYRPAPGQVAIVFTDITESKLYEDELQKGREDLARAQQVGQTGSWRMDVRHNILTWSDENHRIFGIPKGTPMTYETFLDCVAQEDRNFVDQKWKQALSGNDYDIEHRIIVSGQIRWVREKAYLEFDDSGELKGGFGITQDITDRKLAEEQIRNLAKFPAENPMPVLRLSKDGTILYSNSPGQVLLEQWNCQISQKAPEYWCNLISKSLRIARTLVEQIKCGDRVLSFVITPIPDGQYVNLYGRDITVQEQVKDVLRKSRDELDAQVKDRTAELAQTVAVLRQEVEQRKHAELRKNVTTSLLELFAQKTSRKEYLDSVVEIIRDWSGCQCVGIRIMNDEGHIPYESSVGLSEDFLLLENDLFLHKDACVCIRVISQKPEQYEVDFMTAKGSFYCNNAFRFVNSLDENEKKQNRGNCTKAGFVSIAVIPIRYREEMFGAIHLADKHNKKVPVETVEFLEDIASLIGEAVHRFDIEQEILAYQTMLRALALELELAEESERRRIAVDLHDSIGQILAFSRRELSSLEKIDSDEVALSLKEVGRQLDKAIKQTRTLSFELSPSVLYDLGLETALEDLAEIFSRERNIKCSFESSGQFGPIEDAIKVLLYRSVRELLINIAKHAGASEAKITLRKLNHEAHINIEDNGKGFDASILERHSRKSRGFGLFSIQERLSHIEGRFEIQTVKDGGTKITLVAPLITKGNERKD